LGEFLPSGRLFSLGSFSKITEVLQNFGQFIAHISLYIHKLWQKGFGNILDDFYQTHLVTLVRCFSFSDALGRMMGKYPSVEIFKKD
jgi:hypothetical protein